MVRYIDKDAFASPITYNLSVFMEPKLLLDMLLVRHARANYIDVNDLELHMQVNKYVTGRTGNSI